MPMQDNVAPSQLERQIALWNGKIVPRSFRLLGGEPTLNKHILDHTRIARQGWPAPGHGGPVGTSWSRSRTGCAWRVSRLAALPRN